MSTEIPPREKLFDQFSALSPQRERDQIDSPTAISQLAEQASGDPTKVLFGDGRFDYAAASGGLPDAPSNGTSYGRLNGAWTPVLPLAGGTMTGAITLAGAPTAPLQPATKSYVDSNTIPDAPSNGVTYGRLNATWTAVLPTTGGSLSGPLVLASDPTLSLGAATKQYVDAHAFTDAPQDSNLYGRFNGAWSRAVSISGSTMTGPLILGADPTTSLGAATKQYVDTHAGGIPDAPSDNSYYGRINAAWSPVLSIAGGTLTGPLVLAADPTTSLGAATKQYVDAHAGGGGLVDAPSDGTTYGRNNAAWVNVLRTTGGTLTGALTITPTSGIPVNQIFVNATQPSMVLNATTASSAKFVLGQNAGLNRWMLALGNASPETGSNAGDNFALQSYDDSGNALAIPLSITRPGVATFANAVILNADPTTALGAATKQYVDTTTGNYLPLAGGTLTGTLTITPSGTPLHQITINTQQPSIVLNANGAQPSPKFLLSQNNGSNRWYLALGDTLAETGSNVGDNCTLYSFDDSGNALVTPLSITRPGVSTFGGPVILNADPTTGLGAATKQYVDAHAGAGLPDAPNDGTFYGRESAAWVHGVPLTGATLTGALILNADPTVSLGAATKQYVDNTKLSDAPSNSVLYGRLNGAWTAAVPIAGGTMTGALTLSGDPTTTNGAATKHYVDTAPFLLLAGGTMTGTLTLNAAPSSPLQAATKGYVDSLVFTDAPSDGHLYGRSNAAWVQAVPIAGGTMTGSLILNADPSAALGAVTKQYVDATIQGLTPKPTARLATTAALPANTYANGTAGVGATLTANANGALTVDSVAVAANDIVLVKNEATSANNGLYVVTATGSGTAAYVLTRHVDMDQNNEIAGAFIPVGNAGTVNPNSLWLANPSTPVTVGTTSIPFTQLNGATDLIAGNGLSISGNTISAVGTANRIAVGASIDISASYVGQTSITTLGTIATGTWNGTAIANANLAAMAANTIKGNNTGSSAAPIDLTVAQTMTLLGAAPLASPALTGTPTSTTPATADNSTAIATTAYVKAQGYLTGNQTITLTGDATGSGATSIATTLATVNSNVGTFQGLTVNAKGLVTAAVNENYLTANQTITLSGDVSGSGATAITATLATVNSNVGTFQGITVNGKGLVTAAINQNYAPLASPAFTGTPTSTTPATADNSTNVATTAYVQAQGYAVAANYLPLTGGTLSGSLNMTAGVYQYAGKTLAYIVPSAGSADNIFLGESGNTSVTGAQNVGIGPSAGVALTSGSNNISIGYQSLSKETTGNYSVGIGVNSLFNQNGASTNVAIGYLAANDITTGSNNTILGYNSGRGITTGSGNTVVGYNLTGLPAALASTMVLGAGGSICSLVAATNTFHGSSAGNVSVTGLANTGLGYLAVRGVTSGTYNVGIGSSALTAETTGSASIAIGRSALGNQNGGSSNIAIGNLAGYQVTTGANNVFLGSSTGAGITTGSGNTLLGSLPAQAAGLTNTIMLAGGGSVRYDWNNTNANTHTFFSGTAASPIIAENSTPTAGATPVFQSAGALSQTTATSNTPALPSPRTNGYLLIAFGRVTGSTGTTITCSTAGWTQIVNNAGGGRAFAAYYAYVTGSEVAPVFTLGTTDTSDAQVVQYSGTAATSPIGASAVSSGGAATTLSLTGLTTTRYNSKVVASILAGGLSAALTPPAAYTQQASNTDGAWFDAAYTTAGTATGTLAFTTSPAVSNWGGFVIELLIPPMTPTAARHNGQVLGTNRWSIQLTDGTQESGSNAGSNFGIQRYSDAGAIVDTPVSVNRATGQTTITNLNPASVLLRSYLAGLALSTAGSSTMFSVAAGLAMDSTNIEMMVLAASTSKTTGAWTVGSGNGSLDTGAIAASTWYHAYLIERPDTGVIDVLTSLSASTPTMPTNYTVKRRIGSMKTDGSSNWTKFLQTGDVFEWDVGVQEINGGSLSSGSAVTVTLVGVPTGVKVVANISGYATCVTAGATVAAWDADITGSSTTNILFVCPAANNENSFAHGLMVNASAQFKWQSSANFTAVNLFTTGWLDRRGRDA